MTCPKCGGETRVIDSRRNEETVVRRRICERCNTIFHTKEVPVDATFFCDVAYHRRGDKRYDRQSTKSGNDTNG